MREMIQQAAVVFDGSCGARKSRSPAGYVTLSLIGCLMMACAAQVRFVVPGTDVPMTLQSLTMLIIGMTFPASWSLTTMALYLIGGGLGLPVFAGDGGLTGSTGGYLWGFLLAAPLIGFLCGSTSRGWWRLFVAGLAGLAVLLSCGVAWRVLRFGGHVEWAVLTGASPFLIKAVVEAALAAAIVRKFLRGRRRDRIGV